MLTPQQLTHYREHGFVIPGLSVARLNHTIHQGRLQSVAGRGTPNFGRTAPALLTYDTTFLNYARNSGYP